MRINGDFSGVSRIYGKNKKIVKFEASKKASRKKDVMHISKYAKDYQFALKNIKKVPDIRQEKVNKIKQKYESGKYDISGDLIADKLINKLFDEKI